jgi:hypothetical protein
MQSMYLKTYKSFPICKTQKVLTKKKTKNIYIDKQQQIQKNFETNNHMTYIFLG